MQHFQTIFIYVHKNYLKNINNYLQRYCQPKILIYMRNTFKHLQTLRYNLLTKVKNIM